MIEYLYREGAESCSSGPLKVRLDGKICGEIRKVAGGYQYFSIGRNIGGDLFKTVAEVQRSLEEK